MYSFSEYLLPTNYVSDYSRGWTCSDKDKKIKVPAPLDYVIQEFTFQWWRLYSSETVKYNMGEF